MKLYLIQNAFNAGEISPQMLGRSDLPYYRSAVETLENFLIRPQGGICRRSGTRYVADAEDHAVKGRLVPFVFSTTQAYILEFSDLKVRFYKNEAVILAPTWTFVDGDVSVANDEIAMPDHYYVDEQGPFRLTSTGGLPAGLAIDTDYYIVNTGLVGSPATDYFGLSLTPGGAKVDITNNIGGGVHTIAPYGIVPNEIVTTYTEAELPYLRFAQSADILYIVHEDHPPATLTRYDHTEWVLADHSFIDGPYLEMRVPEVGDTWLVDTITIDPAAVSGTGVAITAAGAGFFDAARDVGRMLRFQLAGAGGMVIASVANATTGTVDIVSGSANHLNPPQLPAHDPPSSVWHLGAYYPCNYPRTVAFFEGRLAFAGTPLEPERFDASVTGAWDDFAPLQRSDNKVVDDGALSYQLGGANDVQVIRWLATTRNLIIGTTGGIWPVQSSSLNDAVTPTNINLPRSSAYGCANVQPVSAYDTVVYVSRTGKKILAAGYSYDMDGYRTEDLTIMAEHVTGPGISFMDFQQEPNSIVWALRSDGQLAGMTYERGQKVWGWHRHIIGGSFGTGDAVVESIAVIPSPNEDHDQLWMIVKRTIDGSTVRYIEFMEQDFSDEDDVESAYFVDSGSSLARTGDTGVKDITGISVAAGVITVTAAIHGFINGDKVRITHVSGMTEVNRRYFTVANAAANTFELSGVDGSAYTAYTGDGEVRKCYSTVSGLAHLEGETVTVLADGAVHPDCTVSGGSITLDDTYSEVHVGLPYHSNCVTLPLEFTDRMGSSSGRILRPVHAYIRFHRTLGLEYGIDEDHLERLPFRSAADLMDLYPPLFTGIKEIPLSHGHDKEGKIYLRQPDPLPSTILFISGSVGVSS